jgi:hypothetical protein
MRRRATRSDAAVREEIMEHFARRKFGDTNFLF